MLLRRGSIQIKVFVITEVLETGGEKLIAARLTFEAARAIAKLHGNRKIEKTFATKDECMVPTDPK